MSGAAALRAPAPLLSAQWFRVAGLRPQLDAQAQVERVAWRQEVWHVLVRADGTRSFRLNGAAWSAVARCDARHTVQRLWEIALAELGDDAPTQDELLDILARLHAAGLMSFDRKPDFGAQTAGRAHAPQADAPGRRNSLLSWRVALGHPDALLERLAPRLRVLFTPAALALWAAAVAAAALAAWAHAGELAAQLHAGLATPRTLWMLWIAYPLVKALHELAHGLVARHHGARVPEWGLTLLMFVPVPYVDACAASALPRRRQRLAVAAAGIVVELGLAAAALGVVLALQPGALRDAALVVFFIGALSTLFVNANPLMRFDGYYMLGDALDLPNLAPRSAQHWMHVLRSRVLRLPGEPTLQPAAGEAPWLWAYAPASLAMRWAIAASVVAWLASVSFLLGVAIGAYFAWLLVGKPAWSLWRWLSRGALAESMRAGAQRRALTAAALLALPLAVLPLPDATVVQGVLWLPEHALVRAQADGFVAELLVEDGQSVQVGQPLLRLHAPAQRADQDRLLGRVAALQSERFQALRDDSARAVGVEHELQATLAELDRVQQRIEHLTVRAQAAGRAAIAHAGDLPGRYLARGTLVGHVMTGEPGLVRVAIPQERAALVSAQRGAVQVRLADPAAPALRGRWAGTPSGGGALLPSAALGDRSGGRIATDPDDKQGLRPRQAVLLGEVRLEQAAGNRIGERVHVRFEHGMAPLAWQAARALQQQLLRHFDPTR